MTAAFTGMVILALGACGNAAPAGTAGATATPPPEANSGESPSLTYVDARYHYRIDGPGHLVANLDGSAAYAGPAERLKVEVVQGARAGDVAGLARDDLAAMQSSLAGFHLVSAPAQSNVNGRTVWKFVYTFDAGTSSVTGRLQTLVGVRYYFPKNSTTVAAVTYGIVTNQYDPQGADDIASTFQWQ